MHQEPLSSMGMANWLPAVLLLILLITYLVAVHLQQRRGKRWHSFRTYCFTAGIGLCILAVSPPLANEAHHDLRAHMIQHLLIGMLAPLAFVLAAPLSLTLRVLPAISSRKVTAALKSRPFHFIIHPLTALVLNLGGMYLLYLTPLYNAMQHSMLLHYVVHVHFLAAGYLFTWSIVGSDPIPNPSSFRLRLVILFVSMALHAYLSKFMYAYQYPQNTSHSLAEIQEAAMLMYYGGDLAEVLLAISFFFLWYRKSTSTLHASKAATLV